MDKPADECYFSTAGEKIKFKNTQKQESETAPAKAKKTTKRANSEQQQVQQQRSIPMTAWSQANQTQSITQVPVSKEAKSKPGGRNFSKYITATGKCLETFIKEAKGCAILDIGSMSSLVGVIWVKEYINLLDKHQKNKVKNIEDMGKRFKLSNSQHLKTKATIKISVKLLEKQYRVIIDV